MNNNSTSKTQELTDVSPNHRVLTNANNRRRTVRDRRKSVRLLGKVVELDEWLDWRVKWGQRGAATCASLGLLLFLLYSQALNENLCAQNGHRSS